MKNFLTWFPRIVIIAFALFISVFALDAFSAGGSVWRKMGDFMVHLIPSFVTLLFLGVAWNHRILGGMLLGIWGLIFTIHFSTFRSNSLFMMFSLPLLVSGFLIIFSKLYSDQPEKNGKDFLV